MRSNIAARVVELAGIGMCGKDIALALSVTPQAIAHWAKKLGLTLSDGRKPEKKPLTVELVREYLAYDPLSGVFTRLKKTAAFTVIGETVGTDQGNGYIVIGFAGRRILAHRLAWFYVHGKWPDDHIDHINGIRSDNRIANLRDVTNKINSENRTCSPKSGAGYFGVSFDARRNAYRSRIMHNRKEIWLGYFDSPEKAHEAYIQAKVKYHEGHVDER